MNAPIAEVPPPAPRRAPKQAPTSLSVVVIAGLVLGAVDIVLMMIFPMRLISEVSETWETVLTFGTLFLLYFLPLLLVWRGANWARWLTIALSSLGILASLVPDDLNVSLPLIREIINWLYLPYYLSLIVFLLTPAMRRHFASAPTETLTK